MAKKPNTKEKPVELGSSGHRRPLRVSATVPLSARLSSRLSQTAPRKRQGPALAPRKSSWHRRPPRVSEKVPRSCATAESAERRSSGHRRPPRVSATVPLSARQISRLASTSHCVSPCWVFMKWYIIRGLLGKERSPFQQIWNAVKGNIIN